MCVCGCVCAHSLNCMLCDVHSRNGTTVNESTSLFAFYEEEINDPWQRCNSTSFSLESREVSLPFACIANEETKERKSLRVGFFLLNSIIYLYETPSQRIVSLLGSTLIVCLVCATGSRNQHVHNISWPFMSRPYLCVEVIHNWTFVRIYAMKYVAGDLISFPFFFFAFCTCEQCERVSTDQQQVVADVVDEQRTRRRSKKKNMISHKCAAANMLTL